MERIYIGPQGTPTSQGGVESDKTRALGHLEKIFRESRGFLYKIGISTNPTTRSYGHNQTEVDRREVGDMIYVTIQKGFWERMYVIFQTPLSGAVRDAEKEFIAHARKNFGNFQTSELVEMNDSSGGGGPLGSEGPYYLYVLRR